MPGRTRRIKRKSKPQDLSFRSLVSQVLIEKHSNLRFINPPYVASTRKVKRNPKKEPLQRKHLTGGIKLTIHRRRKNRTKRDSKGRYAGSY